MDKITVKVVKTNPECGLEYKTPGSAGADLKSIENTVVPAKGKVLVKTGLKIAIPDGYYGRIAPRSGLAYKHRLFTNAGVIDSDYRLEVGVVMENFSDIDYHISIGDSIAQLIFEKCSQANFEYVDSLDDTERIGGFGSTGK